MNELLTRQREKAPQVQILGSLIRSEKVLQDLDGVCRAGNISVMENDMREFLEGVIDEKEFDKRIYSIMERLTGGV